MATKLTADKTSANSKAAALQVNAKQVLHNNLFGVLQSPTGPDVCRTQPECPPQPCVRKRRGCDKGFDWETIRCLIAKFAAELLACFAIALILPIRDYFLFAGVGDPGFIVAAAARAAITAGLMLAMMLFKAGHFNPIYTIVQWLCEQNMWEFMTIAQYVVILLGQFFGYLFGAWLVSAFVAAPLSCTIINPLLGNGFGYLFEALGTLFLLFVFALAVHRKTSAMTGVLGLAGAEFAWVAAFAPLTGGSFNFFRSTGVALVQGAPCTNSLGIYVAAMFSALVVGIVLLIFVFPHKLAASDGYEVVLYPPPPVVVEERAEKDC